MVSPAGSPQFGGEQLLTEPGIELRRLSSRSVFSVEAVQTGNLFFLERNADNGRARGEIR